MSILKSLFLVGLAITILEGGAWAAKMGGGNSSYSDSGGNSGRTQGRQDMMLDVTVNYLRDTNANGATDTAGKVSLGGNINEWFGADVQGLYQVHAKNYLIGGDLRFMPIDWFFIKGGVGGYAQKATNSLSLTPLAGVGMIAHFARDYYLVTETSYFAANDHANVSFGVGLGLSF